MNVDPLDPRWNRLVNILFWFGVTVGVFGLGLSLLSLVAALQ
jgi:hypothetical protein